jgi:hypothetical protein
MISPRQCAWSTLVLALAVACNTANFAGQEGKVDKNEAAAQPTPGPGTPQSATPANNNVPPVTGDDTSTAPGSGSDTGTAPTSENPGSGGGTAPGTDPSTTPTVPDECSNTADTTGVKDASSGLTFKLMTSPMTYDDGIKACAAVGANGKLIYQGQPVPDEVLKCERALGTLWLRRPDAGLNLWTPNVLGEDEKSAQHWIICYY